MVGSPEPAEMRFRITVRVLVVLASFLAFLAIFTSWIDRQVLDTDQWVDTSGKMLEDEEISDAVALYAVDQLYANIDVAGQLEKRLPEPVNRVAGPLSGGLRDFATRAAEQALQSERLQTAWRDANRIAHSQLLEILKGDNELVSTETGRIVLNLRPVVFQLADRIGLREQAEGKLPPDIGKLEIADAEQLQTARTITRLLEGLAWLFSIGTLVLFAIAAYLARGRRWVVVLGYGLGLVAAGLAAIAVRSISGGLLVDELAQAEAARVPAEHAWTISTELLHSIATSVIAGGVLFTLASYVASPANGAVTMREALAPNFRERPGVVWGVFAAAVFLYLIISPPDGTRQLVVVLSLFALAAAGLEALSRKTAQEFPDARRGEWLVRMRQRARLASASAGRRIGSAMRELTEEERDPEELRLERLERLGELKEKGVLTAAEFRAEKKRVLAGTVE
jgi:hypothetical protein